MRAQAHTLFTNGPACANLNPCPAAQRFGYFRWTQGSKGEAKPEREHPRAVFSDRNRSLKHFPLQRKPR